MLFTSTYVCRICRYRGGYRSLFNSYSYSFTSTPETQNVNNSINTNVHISTENQHTPKETTMALSSTARDFRLAYIQYMISEAMSTTNIEDQDKIAREIQDSSLQLPFRELVDMAIYDGFINSFDDIYTEPEGDTL